MEANMMLRAVLTIMLLALPSPVLSCPLQLGQRVSQGELVVGQAKAGTRITFKKTDLRIDPASGVFAFGIDRDADREAVLAVSCPDGAKYLHKIDVVTREYDIDRIDGLPRKMVTPPKELLERIRREGKWIREARARDTEIPRFVDGFIWPVMGRISGHYGQQRILNGKPRSPHLGVDIAAPLGTPIKAAAEGEVLLAESDLFYTGGTVVIDHGHGITTIYSHMLALKVAVGQWMTQGEIIGTLGATGRATGPHLDWRINWFQVRLDPELSVGPMRKD